MNWADVITSVWGKALHVIVLVIMKKKSIFILLFVDF